MKGQPQNRLAVEEAGVMAHLGIDLGTSNTLVALVTTQGYPEILRIDGAEMVPSVVYIEEVGGNPIIGRAALDMWSEPDCDPASSFRGWKPLIGEGKVLGEIRPGGAGSDALQITPEYLTMLMVEFIASHIATGLGGEPIETVLVTVPHGWRRTTPEKCRTTREAASRARINGLPLCVQEITVSEPVAAAAYWINQSSGQSRHDLTNKTVLVCDVGGGTFDLSLIRIGGPSRPLDVVDAANSNFAGDYADALVCAWVCARFNEEYGTQYPTNAEAIVSATVSSGKEYSWLRGWIMKAQEIKHKMSERISNPARSGLIVPVKQNFTDANGNYSAVSLDRQAFDKVLEPFYAKGQDLLRAFLHRPGIDAPHAVVFCGGGSKLPGVREQIVSPVLNELYPAEAEQILSRIQINPRRVDQAIALGAALIANGIITVQERLLHDVGIVMVVEHPEVLKALNLTPDQRAILVTPILANKAPLPAVISSSDLGIHSSVAPGERLTITIVVDDDIQAPWAQNHMVSHPAGGERQSLYWGLKADVDGMLILTLKTETGEEVLVQQQWERQKPGMDTIIAGPPQSWPRVDPARLKAAIDSLNAP
jgi:molecular chaperone DnaK